MSTFSPKFVLLPEGADGMRCPQRVDVNHSSMPHDILALSATHLAVAFSDKPIHLEPVNYSRRPIRSEADAEARTTTCWKENGSRTPQVAPRAPWLLSQGSLIRANYGVGLGCGLGRGLGVALGGAGVGVPNGGVGVAVAVGVTLGVGVVVGVAVAVAVGVGVAVGPHGVAVIGGVGFGVGVGGGVPTAAAILTRPQPYTLFGGVGSPHWASWI